MKTDPKEWIIAPSQDDTSDFDTDDDILDEDNEFEMANIGDEEEEEKEDDQDNESTYSINDLIAKYNLRS